MILNYKSFGYIKTILKFFIKSNTLRIKKKNLFVFGFISKFKNIDIYS